MSVREHIVPVLLAATLTTALTAAAVPATARHGEESGSGRCYLVQQLDEPAERVLYTARLQHAQAAATSAYGEVYTNTVSFTLPSGEQIDLDSFSFDCIACHDGGSAPCYNVRLQGSEGRRGGRGIESVTGPHPIGMHYGSTAYVNDGLRPVREVGQKLLFVDGKVGCLSCHDMFNPAKYHLAMDTEQSQLCFACHKK
jgi:predicted CXXCH cytochrome family protein